MAYRYTQVSWIKDYFVVIEKFYTNILRTLIDKRMIKMNNADNKQNSQVENRMKLSDIFGKEFNFMPVLFIKFFSELEHRNDFISGNIYSNTFDYMVQCEKV